MAIVPARKGPIVRFTLRLPPELYATLKARADAEHRTITAEIIKILLEAVNPKKP